MRQAIRLFCFPYSGASAHVYASWRRALPAWIELYLVELPGRGSRASEPLETTMDGLVQRVQQSVLPHARPPFAFFGHSMGALLAHELAHILTYQEDLEPNVLFASGASAPSRRNGLRYASLKSEEELVTELEELEGTRREVLDNPDLMRLILPVLRADFAACGSYCHEPRPRLRCPIQVLAGRDDCGADAHSIQAWGAHTSGALDIAWFAGGHFFIHENRAQLLDLIRRRLAPLVCSPARTHATATDTEHET